ncbi:hypothetical protein K2Q16_01595 [Patescibacteria group bacterium]|nr:hypothetical protein [Patescibacteria group bacterium]
MAKFVHFMSLLLFVMGLSACVSREEMTELRIQSMELQARETNARNRLTAAQVAAARAAGQTCTGATVVDSNAFAGVPSQGRVVCTTPGVVVPNEARLPQSARAGWGHGEFRRPYNNAYQYHFGVGNTLPRGYWGGGNRTHRIPDYAPYGIAPYWDGREWVCRNPWSGNFRCLIQ